MTSNKYKKPSVNVISNPSSPTAVSFDFASMYPNMFAGIDEDRMHAIDIENKLKELDLWDDLP